MSRHVIKKSHRLTLLNGKAVAVISDTQGYQRFLDIAASADPKEGIRQGLHDAKRGRTRPASRFFDEFEARHGLSR